MHLLTSHFKLLKHVDWCVHRTCKGSSMGSMVYIFPCIWTPILDHPSFCMNNKVIFKRKLYFSWSQKAAFPWLVEPAGSSFLTTSNRSGRYLLQGSLLPVITQLHWTGHQIDSLWYRTSKMDWTFLLKKHFNSLLAIVKTETGRKLYFTGAWYLQKNSNQVI